MYECVGCCHDDVGCSFADGICVVIWDGVVSGVDVAGGGYVGCGGYGVVAFAVDVGGCEVVVVDVAYVVMNGVVVADAVVGVVGVYDVGVGVWYVVVVYEIGLGGGVVGGVDVGYVVGVDGDVDVGCVAAGDVYVGIDHVCGAFGVCVVGIRVCIDIGGGDDVYAIVV